MKKGKLLVVSGPSGSGKGTVLGEVLKRRDDVCMSVSATSRSPRPNEKDGVNYFFVSRERFKEMIEKEELLEYAEFCENYYGTPAEAVNKNLEAGKSVILEIEVQGAMQIKKKCPEAVLIFIKPPSIEILRERLTGRGTEEQDVIEKRLSAALWELGFENEYDFSVVNDEVSRAAEEIENIIEKENKND